jgi:hypothetical protein
MQSAKINIGIIIPSEIAQIPYLLIVEEPERSG